MKSLSLVRLFATPWVVAYQAPMSMGFSRQEYWSGLPFPSPGYLPDPGIEPRSATLEADTLTSEPPREAHYHIMTPFIPNYPMRSALSEVNVVTLAFFWLVSMVYSFPSFYFLFLLATESCLTFCDPMDCSTPGFPVLHCLLELAQTHAHWVSNAVQPSHPLLPPLSALNLSQHQGLFQWVSSSHQVAKILELRLQHQSFQWTFRTDLL